MKDKYVLDSSVWIEIERKNQKIIDKVNPLIQTNRIALIDVIKAEILRGAKTRKDYAVLAIALNNFPVYSTNWDRVADLAFRVSRRGFNPPLIDLYIAQAVIENKKTLITQDKHFDPICTVQSFSLEFLE